MELHEIYKTPGQYIQHLLDERGWTQRVLALIVSTDEATINKVITGKRPLEAGLAISLGQALDTAAEDFLLLQKHYDLAVARLISRPDPSIATRAKLFGGLPVSEMVKRGWLPGVADLKDVPQLETSLKSFLAAAHVTGEGEVPHSAKKTETERPASPVQFAWVCRVREVAAEIIVSAYSEAALRSAIGQMQKLLSSPEGVRRVPRLLTEAGVRLVFVEGLTGAKIDGVCTWLDDSSPVIGLSLRFDRIDNFWFVLRHEMEHVLQGDGKTSPIIDAELEGDRAGTGEGVAEEERIANQAAAAFCVDQAALNRFIAKKSPVFAERDILGFARTLQVHPGLVAGQLQRKLNRFDRFRTHLAKTRVIALAGGVYDGWGEIAPIHQQEAYGN